MCSTDARFAIANKCNSLYEIQKDGVEFSFVQEKYILRDPSTSSDLLFRHIALQTSGNPSEKEIVNKKSKCEQKKNKKNERKHWRVWWR